MECAKYCQDYVAAVDKYIFGYAMRGNRSLHFKAFLSALPVGAASDLSKVPLSLIYQIQYFDIFRLQDNFIRSMHRLTIKGVNK